MLSSAEKYLWVTTRAKTKTKPTEYISCFGLNDTGAIQRKLFMVPTTGANGNVAAVSPASFDDQYVALVDSGHVQNWQMKNGTGRYVNTTAVPIAKEDISDGGCCANAIWYD
jgi:carboxy-cis,cis-muconate cyclase